jgi:hypothetical protein
MTFVDSDPEPAQPQWSGRDEDRPKWIAADRVWKEQHGQWLERAIKRAARPDLVGTSEHPDYQRRTNANKQ